MLECCFQPKISLESSRLLKRIDIENRAPRLNKCASQTLFSFRPHLQKTVPYSVVPFSKGVEAHLKRQLQGLKNKTEKEELLNQMGRPI